jgi:toxin YoeB
LKGKKKKNKKQPDELPVKSDSSQILRYPVFSDTWREDLGWWYKTDKQKAYKILDLVSEVMKEPFSGIGKPEPLKFLDPDTWSRRIDLEHRLVYRVRAERIDFLKARYHYTD